jgi:hypothetical protein
LTGNIGFIVKKKDISYDLSEDIELGSFFSLLIRKIAASQKTHPVYSISREMFSVSVNEIDNLKGD